MFLMKSPYYFSLKKNKGTFNLHELNYGEKKVFNEEPILFFLKKKKRCFSIYMN